MSTRPEVERALIQGKTASSDDEVQRFYAQRVSDYAAVLALIFGGIYVFGVVFTLIVLPQKILPLHLHPGKLAHLGVTLAAVAVWRVARRPGCPPWFVMASDVLLPVAIAEVVLLVSKTGPRLSGMFVVPLLVAAPILVLRAALVPSRPLRTALVGITTAGATVVATYTLASSDEALSPPLTPLMVGVASAAWSGGLVVATVFVSRVIYGLHREVASAKRLGQYVLGELIGEGGMGAVYRADHAMLRRPTAVKVLSPERAGRESIARFEREVRLTARLTHPNTVAVYDYGRTPEGLFYYAMEYLDGLSLEALVTRFGAQPPARVIHILAQAAGALSEAHGLGLIHRDVKPANILFCERGGAPDTVKLLDFGLVKSLEPEAGPELTHADAITGTPLYLAPESITNPTGVDHRVDLYALGAVAYFLLTARPPFQGKSVLEICGHHLHTVPEPPSAFAPHPVPAKLESVILGCLAKNPGDRPESALAVHEALLECAAASPWSPAEAKRFWRELREEPRAATAADSAA